MITKEQQDFATFKSMIISKGVNLSDLISLEHSFNVDDLINTADEKMYQEKQVIKKNLQVVR